jgi:hypothetical protein
MHLLHTALPLLDFAKISLSQFHGAFAHLSEASVTQAVMLLCHCHHVLS